MMMVRSFLVGLTVMAGVATAQDAAAEALRDMQIGMQGLKQAGSDPALLAQLMQDLQVRHECSRDVWVTGRNSLFALIEPRTHG